MKSKILKKLKFVLFIFLALAYAIWPLDIIPDVIAFLGLADDFVISLILYFLYRRAGKKPQIQKESLKKNYLKISPYKILGISAPASQREIKQAYKKLALKYHPDQSAKYGKNAREEAHEQMVVIQEAYQKLKKVA